MDKKEKVDETTETKDEEIKDDSSKDFEKFAKLLDKTKQKINEAGNTLDEIGHRNEQINKKLKKFDGYEELPESVASSILGAENIDE